MRLVEVIHEDTDLLVVNKPAGLVCHPTKGDAYSSLISRARLHVGATVQPQLVNRLDRETSGITIIAKNPQAAREVRLAFETRTARKQYLAIVHGHVVENHFTVDAALGRDEASAVAIKDMVRADGLPSRTEFEVLSRFRRDGRGFTLLHAWPLTGRKHQIRIHLAHFGHPIVGDKLYGGDENLYLAFVKSQLTEEQRRKLILPNHALHAEQVTFQLHNRDWTFRAPPEPWFEEFCGLRHYRMHQAKAAEDSRTP